MSELEKVIEGIEACNRVSDNGSDCQNCPYYDDEDASELPFGVCNIHDMLADALDLLNERTQQPHSKTFTVIDRKTGKEADEYNIALCEEWAQGLVYCDMDGFALLQNGTLLLCDECGNAVACDPERFEVVWDE